MSALMLQLIYSRPLTTQNLFGRAISLYRLAPATKLAQVFYNKRIKQKRSQSAKPEFEYNLDLIRAFLTDIGSNIVETAGPYLSFESEKLEQQKSKLAQQLGLDVTKPWLYVHAGSGGSANNLSLEQYTSLVCGLAGEFEVVLTAGPSEEEKAAELQTLLAEKGRGSVLYDKNDGLVDFSCSIACADMFIAGSTGPLHIAAAIDVPTIGFSQVNALQHHCAGNLSILRAIIWRFAHHRQRIKRPKRIWREWILIRYCSSLSHGSRANYDKAKVARWSLLLSIFSGHLLCLTTNPQICIFNKR